MRYLLSLTFINPVKNNQSFTRIIDSASGLEQLQNLSYVKSSPKQIKCIQFKKYLMFINIRHSKDLQQWQCNRSSCWQIIAECREVFFSAREIWNFCVFLFTFTFGKTSLGLPLTWTIIKIPRFGCFLRDWVWGWASRASDKENNEPWLKSVRALEHNHIAKSQRTIS